MDLLTVDVTEAMRKGSDIHPGVLMDLIDARHSIDDVAANAGTIGYEILTGLGSRYRRRYAGEAETARPARGGG